MCAALALNKGCTTSEERSCGGNIWCNMVCYGTYVQVSLFRVTLKFQIGRLCYDVQMFVRFLHLLGVS